MQEILCYRIDDRLIHGQIAAVWTKHVKQTRIVVVDDEANRSDLQKQMLRLACPPGIKLSVLSIEKTINNFNQKKYDGDKIFMISKNAHIKFFPIIFYLIISKTENQRE